MQDIGKNFHNNILIIKNRLIYQQMNMSEFFIVLGKILVTHKYPSLWSKNVIFLKNGKRMSATHRISKDVGDTSYTIFNTYVIQHVTRHNFLFFQIKLMVMTRRKSNLNLCRRKRSRIQPEVDQPTISPTKSPSVKKLKQCKSSFLIKIKSPAKNIKFHPISTTEEISTKSPVDLSKGHDRGPTGPCIRLFVDQLQNDMLHEMEHEIKDPPKNDKLQELIALAPAVLNQNNCADSIVKFFKVVSEGKFPLDTIAFLLWIELVNFFSTSNTCEMRYMDSTKKFFKLGWILFGSKFIRFNSPFFFLKMSCTKPGKNCHCYIIVRFYVCYIFMLYFCCVVVFLLYLMRFPQF